jgi:hypothetical protein
VSRSARRRSLALPVLAALALLLATADDRTFGLIGDGQEMFRTAFAMLQYGEIGIAHRDQAAVHRETDDTSRYGMGFSLVLILPLLLSRAAEDAFGPGASQSLLTATQCVLVCSAGYFAALLARRLGADRGGERVAFFGAVFATPLWAYASGDFSEALQAAALAAAAALALVPPDAPARKRNRNAAAAGFAAGLALLTKTFLLPAALVLLAPLLFAGPQRRQTVARAAAGFAGPAALWALFEWVRFDRFFGGYPGEGFTHPVFDGLWRLTVGINKGLFVYGPLTLAGLVAVLFSLRRGLRDRAAWRTAPLLAAFGAILFPVAAWWAWDGTTGWGPRLLVPAIPLLAAAAAAQRHLFPKGLLPALIIFGVAFNLFGVLQTAQTEAAYFTDVPAVVAPIGTVPVSPSAPVEDRHMKIPSYLFAAVDPALAPIRIHAFFLYSRLAGGDVRKRFSHPPWGIAHSELVPRWSPQSWQEPVYASMFEGFRWPFCGDAILGHRPRRDLPEAYIDAVQDQAFRAFDQARSDRFLPLSAELYRRRPDPIAAALLADALRLTDRRGDAHRFLSGLPDALFRTPQVGLATALLARDDGRMDVALRALEELIIPAYPDAAALRTAPTDAWPATVRQFLAEEADRDG